jgi:hypothetical protein
VASETLVSGRATGPRRTSQTEAGNEPKYLQRGELRGPEHHEWPHGEDDDETGQGAQVAAGEDQDAVPSTDCHTCRSASGRVEASTEGGRIGHGRCMMHMAHEETMANAGTVERERESQSVEDRIQSRRLGRFL